MFLERSVFSTYQLKLSAAEDGDEEAEPIIFDVSLPALLETLQMFGLGEIHRDRGSRDSYIVGPRRSISAFDSRLLGLSGICRITYAAPGAPLSIVLQETDITTTCELVTYYTDAVEDIPFSREDLPVRIIMRSSWLHDAVTELASAEPERLIVSAAPTAPFLVLSASGSLGSASVEFEREESLLETLSVHKEVSLAYKFSLIKSTLRAMSVATKASIRTDTQGVLSLQLMIEVEAGTVTFLEFRVAPLLDSDEDGEEPEPNNQSDRGVR